MPGGATVALSAGTTTRAVASALLRVAEVLHESGRDDLTAVLTCEERTAVAGARQVAVVADDSKWGVMGLSTIATLAEVDVVVSDDGLEPGARRILESGCGRLVPAA